ncbi:MAG: hypothetical protein OCD02_20770 [Spirochaetaceae bacterium]
MKYYLILSFFFASTILYGQYYTSQDFLLKGNVNRVSVICYDIELEDEQLIESFPYSTQNRYKTDLNLHYLEFNKKGELTRSKLFYPRDFYGQFTWLKPVFNLEKSDFEGKVNYLAQKNRYNYTDLLDDNKGIKIISENGTEINLILDKDYNLIEDEYYTYLKTDDESKIILTKTRKNSAYGYRRVEKFKTNDTNIEEEYINNRFLVSKQSIIKNADSNESIFISQSRIELKKEEFINNNIVNKLYVNLTWRNKFLKWPDINFDISQGYTEFLKNLERESDQYAEKFEYDNNGNISIKYNFRYKNNQKVLIMVTEYLYNSEGLLLEVMLTPKSQDETDILYKEYKYDSAENWITKIIGKIINVKGEVVKIPTKKYVKTLIYWD